MEKKLTQEEIDITIEAIKELIHQYKNSRVEHTISDCPLCIAFRYKDFIKNVTHRCSICPNTAFITSDHLGCTHRVRDYKHLSYGNDIYDDISNISNILSFWTNVLNLYLNLNITPEYTFEDIKASIIKIAENYK